MILCGTGLNTGAIQDEMLKSVNTSINWYNFLKDRLDSNQSLKCSYSFNQLAHFLKP